MEDVNKYFEDLNKSIRNAKTQKTLKILTKRARRIHKRLFDNSLSNIVKYHVNREYQKSLDLIEDKRSEVKI